MTTLKDVNFGMNEYCGPAVLSILTGESTDRCAAVISAVSGKREIKAVERGHLKEAFKRLKFDVEVTNHGGSSLYGCLFRMRTFPGLYVVFVPKHVIAVEVAANEIFLCDNHSKTPIDIKQSARLMQKVEAVWRVFPHPLPKLKETWIAVEREKYSFEIVRYSDYENEEDNIKEHLGTIRFKDQKELESILYKLHSIYEGEF